MKTTKAGQSSLLLLDVIATLKKLNIDYAVIGALAASFHGVVRGSVDADALISLPDEMDLDDLAKTFKKIGFKTEVRWGGEDDPIPAMLLLKDSFTNRVDLLAGLRGLDAGALSRALESSFLGGKVKIIGLEDFMAMKLFAGSPKDLADARNAWEVSRDKVNKRLLLTLTSRYGNDALENLKTILYS
jgi:hypothetical protein